MKVKVNMKYKIISILILITAFIFSNIKFQNVIYPEININDVFPKTISTWTGKDLEVDKSVSELLPENELIFRRYVNKKTGNDAVVSVVFSFNRDHLHDPAICYRGQGIEIVKKSIIDLDKKNIINLFLGKRNKMDCHVLYWFSDLKSTFPDNAAFSFRVRKAKFLNQPLKGMALVVITSYSSDKQELLDFANSINKTLVNLIH